MTINRVNQKINALATIFNTATAEYTFVDESMTSNSRGVIFDRGTGQSGWDHMGYGQRYGEWTIVPHETFKADVKIWGAGGGAHGSTGGAAGGGGFGRARIEFYKDIPYTVIVGEGGFYAHHNHDSNGSRYAYRSNLPFGNAGGGGHNGGSGGGLSGIFFDAGPTNGGPGAGMYANGTTFRGVGQTTALLIAGGGGGAGHHGTAQHGQGGGGGGSTGHVGHAQSPANQFNGGHIWWDGSHGRNGWAFHGGMGGPNSYTGGGGGGWFGGGGGSYRATGGHHNGGSGGSGHAIDQGNARHPNRWIVAKYPTIVSGSYLETAPGSHQNHNPAAAGTTDSDWVNYVGYGAGNSGTFTPTTSSGNNGRVLIRLA